MDQLWRQAVGAFAVLAFSFIATSIIGLALHKALGFRIDQDAEVAGIDLQEHAETSYDLGSLGGGRIGSGAVSTSSRPPAGAHSATNSSSTQGAST